MWIRKLLGLEPSPAPGHVFAVDRDGLRYGFFARDEEDMSFREYHREPLAESLFQSGPLGGPVRDVDHLEAGLESLLARLPTAPAEASLVLPDAWVRIAIADLEDLPRRANREEVLRFKLRRLVPFRVEELRVVGAELPFPDGSRPGRRVLLGFGVEALLEQLERVFAARGVEIGHISNESLALLPMLDPLVAGGSPAVVVHVTRRSYSLVVTEYGQPILHRFKGLGDPDLRARLVPRELRLTKSYLERELKGRRYGEIVVVAPADESQRFQDWLAEAFEHPVRSLVDEWAELPGTVTGVSSWEAAPLLGAASRGIA